MINQAYCINLDHRTDRWNQVKKQFELHKMNVERISAVDGRTGAYATEGCDNYNNACTLSHIKVLKAAKAKGQKTIMVFEDDVVLHKYIKKNLNDCIEDLPFGWDMLYLGGSHRKPPTKVTDNISRVHQTLTTHAYIIRIHLYDEMIERMMKLDQPVDCFFADIQPIKQVYVTNPPLAWQRGGYSDIAHRNMEYPWLKSNEQ